jgi:hypothetical protein
MLTYIYQRFRGRTFHSGNGPVSSAWFLHWEIEINNKPKEITNFDTQVFFNNLQKKLDKTTHLFNNLQRALKKQISTSFIIPSIASRKHNT